MATFTNKILHRAAAQTGSSTLYTVPASTTAIVTSIVVCNAGASTRTFTLSFNSVQILGTVSITANQTLQYEFAQPLTTGQLITGNASSTDVQFHICGIEIAS
jgi:hypothetical protein